MLHSQVNRTLSLLLVVLALSASPVYGHGGVAFEDDQCVIRIDFLTAHFTVYQPEGSGSEEFCEDLPAAAQSIFILEYLHDFLRQMPVDFRIIRDTKGFGQFANWEHIQTIEDIDAVTVFHQPAAVYPDGTLSAEYAFDSKGSYIGIVSARHPEEQKNYHAVFYFQVGGPDYGSLPLFLALILMLQLGYWISNGGWQRLRHRVSEKQ